MTVPPLGSPSSPKQPASPKEQAKLPGSPHTPQNSGRSSIGSYTPSDPIAIPPRKKPQ